MLFITGFNPNYMPFNIIIGSVAYLSKNYYLKIQIRPFIYVFGATPQKMKFFFGGNRLNFLKISPHPPLILSGGSPPPTPTLPYQ